MLTDSVVRLRPAETAKAMRAALKAAFPSVKFSVTTKQYSGGSSLTVRYFRGPATRAVDRIADRFQGRDFDGMTDSSTYRPPTLLCGGDGSVRKVDYGSSFVFVEREYDADRYGRSEVCAAVESAILARYVAGTTLQPGRTGWREMGETDWPDGMSVQEFAARCAGRYFQ